MCPCSLPAQVLLLWDRLLGYDSLELLPVLAAAVLVFRADLIMQVRCYSATVLSPSVLVGSVIVMILFG